MARRRLLTQQAERRLARKRPSGRGVGVGPKRLGGRIAPAPALRALGGGAASIEQLDVRAVAVARAVAGDAVAGHAEVGLSCAALDGSAAAALDIHVLETAVLRAEGRSAVDRAPVRGLHVAAFRMPAAAVYDVELARQPVRCAEARTTILKVTKRRDGAAAWMLTAPVHQIHVGGSFVPIAEEESALGWISKCWAYSAASAVGANLAQQVNFRIQTMLLAMDGVTPAPSEWPEIGMPPTHCAFHAKSLCVLQLTSARKAQKFLPSPIESCGYESMRHFH